MSPPIFALRSFSLVARVHTLPFTLRDEPRAGLRAAGDGRSAFGGGAGSDELPQAGQQLQQSEAPRPPRNCGASALAATAFVSVSVHAWFLTKRKLSIPTDVPIRVRSICKPPRTTLRATRSFAMMPAAEI